MRFVEISTKLLVIIGIYYYFGLLYGWFVLKLLSKIESNRNLF